MPQVRFRLKGGLHFSPWGTTLKPCVDSPVAETADLRLAQESVYSTYISRVYVHVVRRRRSFYFARFCSKVTHCRKCQQSQVSCPPFYLFFF